MANLPSEPIAPKEFMEEFLPRALSEGDLAASAGDDGVQLGVRLDGEGGGEWVVHLRRGALEVAAGSREGAAFTIVQTVEDWRGALWEGRGGVFGRQATAMFQGATGDAGEGGSMGLGAATPNAAAIGQLASLDGLIQVVVTGGAGGDWTTGFKLGPGVIPDEPNTRLVIASEDAEAMSRGELDPMSAFMSGKVQVIGDMALMMQMQAITMQAAMAGGGGAR